MPQIQTEPKPLQLLSDIRKRPWFVHDHESLFPRALAILRGERLGDEAPIQKLFSYSEEPTPLSQPEETATNLVAVIPIIGTILKYDSFCTYGAETYALAIRQAAANPDVCALILDIDSGGGAGNAIAILKESIAYAKEAGKPVIAHVDCCASLAYWLASQCDAIFCDNLASEVGSIGAFYHIVDDTGALEKEGYKVLSVYANESPDKNLPYRKAVKEDDYSLMQQDP